MAKDENTYFFKMITIQGSHFAKVYNISEIDDIYPGRRFVSRGKPFEWCQNYSDSGIPTPGITLQNPVPMIHFCDNAIDLLMWYRIGMKSISPWQEVYFFEILPLSPVHKQTCNDKNKLYQCGAWHIEIIRQITIGEIFRIASQEIKDNIDEIINRYPDQNMMKIILYIQENVIRKRQK